MKFYEQILFLLLPCIVHFFQILYTFGIQEGKDNRSKRGYNSIVCKKDTTPQTYRNEKAEKYNSDKGQRKNLGKAAQWYGE